MRGVEHIIVRTAESSCQSLAEAVQAALTQRHITGHCQPASNSGRKRTNRFTPLLQRVCGTSSVLLGNTLNIQTQPARVMAMELPTADGKMPCICFGKQGYQANRRYLTHVVMMYQETSSYTVPLSYLEFYSS